MELQHKYSDTRFGLPNRSFLFINVDVRLVITIIIITGTGPDRTSPSSMALQWPTTCVCELVRVIHIIFIFARALAKLAGPARARARPLHSLLYDIVNMHVHYFLYNIAIIRNAYRTTKCAPPSEEHRGPAGYRLTRTYRVGSHGFIQCNVQGAWDPKIGFGPLCWILE